MTDVFLSYQHEDRDKAEVLARELAARGLDVWWDTELLPGERFGDEIALVIGRAKVAVVLWSERAINSRWVRAEARLALDREILIPVRLQEVAPPLPFNDLHAADLTGWEGSTEDPRLSQLVDTVAWAAGGTKETAPGSPAAESAKTDERLHGYDDEARLWAAISTRNPQSAKEYRLYLERHPKGLFADLAELRLQEFQSRRIPGPKALLAGASAIVALVGGIFGLVVAWPQVLDVVRPEAEPTTGAPAAVERSPVESVAEPVAIKNLPDCTESELLTPCRDRLADGAACSWCPELVPIRAGHILLRGPNFNPAEAGEGPFAIPELAVARYETTVAEFRAFAELTAYEAEGCTVNRDSFMSSFQPWSNWRAPDFEQKENHPAVCLSKRDAETYAAWLSEVTGQSYRLPTEEEWEYFARAGTTTAYPLGDELRPDDANFGNRVQGTRPGGLYPANAWGIYDVTGNVEEWTATCEPAGKRINCEVRGGGWVSNSLVLDLGFSSSWLDDDRRNDLGFRVVRARPIPEN